MSRVLDNKTRDNGESGDEYDDNSIMPPLTNKEEMDVMDSGDESEDKPMSTDMLENICDGIQSHPSVNKRKSRYKYAIALYKDNRNGKERYYLRKTWVNVYTKCLILL